MEVRCLRACCLERRLTQLLQVSGPRIQMTMPAAMSCSGMRHPGHSSAPNREDMANKEDTANKVERRESRESRGSRESPVATAAVTAVGLPTQIES